MASMAARRSDDPTDGNDGHLSARTRREHLANTASLGSDQGPVASDAIVVELAPQGGSAAGRVSGLGYRNKSAEHLQNLHSNTSKPTGAAAQTAVEADSGA